MRLLPALRPRAHRHRPLGPRLRPIAGARVETVASNRYHPEGKAAGRFDVVLEPSHP